MSSATYRESGYQVFRQVLQREEVAAAQPDVAHHVATADRGQSRSLIVPFDLAQVSPVVRSLLLDRRLARIAANLLGCGRVRYLHASAYYKVRGAPEARWHQDLWFMPLPEEALITLWIPLCDVDETMAPLVYAVGSHRGGAMQLPEGFKPSDSSSLEFSRPTVLQAGDLTAHHGWTLHASTEPESEHPREAVGICYVPDGTVTLSRPELEAEPFRWEIIRPYLDPTGSSLGQRLEGDKYPIVFFD